jgi:hypothetical protein
MTTKTEKQARQGLGDEAEAAIDDAQATVSPEPTLEPPNSDTRMPNRQHRDVKASDPPSPDEVKARLEAARQRGPSRPLYALAKAEADLNTRSAALAQLSGPEKKRPDLLIHQLTSTVNTSYVPRVIAPKLRNDTVALYSDLHSSDPIESILDRLTVATLNNVMACHARAARTENLKAIDVNLRQAAKGTRVVIDLIEARARRRGPQKVRVGNVNVKAGGQAIVGNVEAPKNRSKTKTRNDSSHDTESSPGRDEDTDD